MNQRNSLLLFLAVSTIQLFAQLSDNHNLAIGTKILLMPTLALWYHQATTKEQRLNSVLLALFFSWLGDCLLILAKEKPLFFLLGLASFLLAHCHYIYTFIKNGAKFRLNFFTTTIIVITISYLITLLSMLLPVLPDPMKIPVIVYGIVLCSTLCISLFLLDKLMQNWLFLFLGIILFITSDSLIALNRFRPELLQTLPNVSFLIMLTYLIAQFWIIRSLSHLNNPDAA